jgi:hypothetical protein
MEMKKIYRRPTLAVHGGAMERTNGQLTGDYSDYFHSFRKVFPS